MSQGQAVPDQRASAPCLKYLSEASRFVERTTNVKTLEKICCYACWRMLASYPSFPRLWMASSSPMPSSSLKVSQSSLDFSRVLSFCFLVPIFPRRLFMPLGRFTLAETRRQVTREAQGNPSKTRQTSPSGGCRAPPESSNLAALPLAGENSYWWAQAVIICSSSAV